MAWWQLGLGNTNTFTQKLFVKFNVEATMEGTIGAFTMEASASNVGNLDTFIPRFTLEATHLTGAVGNLDIVISPLTIEALTGHSLESNSPAFIIEANLLRGNIGSLDEIIARFVIQGTSTVGVNGRLDATIGTLTISATHQQTNQADLDVPVAAFFSQGNYIQGQLMNADLTISAFTIIASGYTINNATLVSSIAPLVMYGHIPEKELAYVKTIVMNLRNFVNTEYTNYAFESMAHVGNTLVGVNSTGIYELSGADDNGTNIDGNVRVGYFDTQNEVFQKLHSCYVSSKTNGNFEVELITEDGNVRTFLVTFFQDRFITRRVKFPRDMKDRYYSINLKNVNGAEMELHKIDLETNLVKEKV